MVGELRWASRVSFLIALCFGACRSPSRDFDPSAGVGGTSEPGGSGDAGETSTSTGGADSGAGGKGGSGAGGKGGSGAGGEAGGTPSGGDAGEAGGPPADPCLGATCDTPPANGCLSGSQYRAYDTIGSCVDGECSYTSNDVACSCSGDACETDPCLEITCDAPPSASCPDENTLRSYAATGTCELGSCSYAPSDTPCEFGCFGAACNPCTTQACNDDAPHDACQDSDTLLHYAGTGSCDQGSCSYSPTSKECPGGCNDDACSTDVWLALPTNNGPSARRSHTAVWTGSEMIVWGGEVDFAFTPLNTGASYSPATGNWSALPTSGAPSARESHTAVWTGNEMIVWGGAAKGVQQTGGARYSGGSWTAMSSSGAPSPRTDHTAVWTGDVMIVWGGRDAAGVQSLGSKYDPDTNAWGPTTTTTGAPAARDQHSAVWTGTEMIVWGGSTGVAWPNTGARYNPSQNTWTATATTNAPSGRSDHVALWTGSEMIIWGGVDNNGYFNDGARYNPSSNTWTAMSTTNAPDARALSNAVWTGSVMIVWGGMTPSEFTASGGIYDPSTNSWTPISTLGAPSGRHSASGVWTGTELIVFGGNPNGVVGINNGGRYVP